MIIAGSKPVYEGRPLSVFEFSVEILAAAGYQAHATGEYLAKTGRDSWFLPGKWAALIRWLKGLFGLILRGGWPFAQASVEALPGL